MDAPEVVIVGTIIVILGAVCVPTVAKFNRHSTVTVDGKEVFKGRAFCVEVKSAGAATEVDLGSGPLCLFPGDHYVSKDVHVETH